jgi:hypothetical protein
MLSFAYLRILTAGDLGSGGGGREQSLIWASGRGFLFSSHSGRRLVPRLSLRACGAGAGVKRTTEREISSAIDVGSSGMKPRGNARIRGFGSSVLRTVHLHCIMESN